MRVFADLPLEHLDFPNLFVAFQANDPALGGLLPLRPLEPGTLWRMCDGRRGFARPEDYREGIAQALGIYAERFEAPTAVMDAVASFAKPGTLAIVTGQQPGLLGGPLYTFHKVATALQLARQLRALPDAPEIVTIFWNHSEDHDWAEANHTWLVNPAFDVQRVRLSLPSTGRPLDDLALGNELRSALAEARDLLPKTDHFLRETALFQLHQERETLAEQLSRQLFEHFGEHGLLVLEPYCLPAETREVLAEFHARSERVRGVLKGSAGELLARGFDVTVDPETAFSFHISTGGKRTAVPDAAPLPIDGRLSPGVLHRNLWQDSILPTLAFVAGPGEVHYLALAGGMYGEFGVPRPPLIPRASFTHVDGKLYEFLERWQIGAQDLQQGTGHLERLISEREGASQAEFFESKELIEEQMRHLADEFATGLRELEQAVAEIDRNLILPMAKLGSRSRSEARKIADKIARQRAGRSGVWRQHARRLSAWLLPRGSLQERILPALPFLVRNGHRFTEDLIEWSDPFATTHRVARLPDVD